MRRPLPSKDQMHLRQQRSILGVPAEQIRVRNSATDLPLTLTVIPLVVLALTLPRAEVRVEVGWCTIICRG